MYMYISAIVSAFANLSVSVADMCQLLHLPRNCVNLSVPLCLLSNQQIMAASRLFLTHYAYAMCACLPACAAIR